MKRCAVILALAISSVLLVGYVGQFTPGSIIFADTNGFPIQANSKLYMDQNIPSLFIGAPGDGPLGMLSVYGGIITTNRPGINVFQQWNAAGVTFTGLVVKITSTASAAGSLVADFEVGGLPVFQIGKDGGITAQAYMIPGSTGYYIGSTAASLRGLLSDGPSEGIVKLSGAAQVNSLYGLAFGSLQQSNALMHIVSAPIGASNATVQFRSGLTNEYINVEAGSFFLSGSNLNGGNRFVAPHALTTNTMGARLWTDGTNLCVVMVNAAGTRTTNKVTVSAWP